MCCAKLRQGLLSPLLKPKLAAVKLASLHTRPQEERARRRLSARPLPPTTDMPSIPPRPEPRELTVPAPYRWVLWQMFAHSLVVWQQGLTCDRVLATSTTQISIKRMLMLSRH